MNPTKRELNAQLQELYARIGQLYVMDLADQATELKADIIKLEKRIKLFAVFQGKACAFKST